jgi:hypothetical protein
MIKSFRWFHVHVGAEYEPSLEIFLVSRLTLQPQSVVDSLF